MDYDENLPLSEAVFFILLSLAPGPKHGYAIMKDVQALSDSRVGLSTGTLYGALKRLLDGGRVRRVDEVQDELAANANPMRLRNWARASWKLKLPGCKTW